MIDWNWFQEVKNDQGEVEYYTTFKFGVDDEHFSEEEVEKIIKTQIKPHSFRKKKEGGE